MVFIELMDLRSSVYSLETKYLPVNLITSINVPDPYSSVMTGRDYCRTVWVDIEGVHHPSVPDKHHLYVPLVVPDFNCKRDRLHTPQWLCSMFHYNTVLDITWLKIGTDELTSILTDFKNPTLV